MLAPVSLLVLAVLPLLAIHAQNLWHRSHYQFFPIVPLGAVVLALPACRRLGPLVPGSPTQGRLAGRRLLAPAGDRRPVLLPVAGGRGRTGDAREPSRTGSGAAVCCVPCSRRGPSSG